LFEGIGSHAGGTGNLPRFCFSNSTELGKPVNHAHQLGGLGDKVWLGIDKHRSVLVLRRVLPIKGTVRGANLSKASGINCT
jgi:hypothetical protein